MQFTPLFKVPSDDICLTATSNGGVSGSIPIGPYEWEYHMFTASNQSTYDTASLYSFNMTNGFTKDGILLLVGGGGGGAFKGDSNDYGSGGAGGVLLKTGVNYYKSSVPFSIQVGHGGSGTSVSSSGVQPTNHGNDGQQSKFIGLNNPLVDEGIGGFYLPSPYGNGGGSGNDFSGGTGSIYGAGGGAGATEDGQDGGTLTVAGGHGGRGYNIYNILPSYLNRNPKDPETDTPYPLPYVPFRIGGGGQTSWTEGSSGDGNGSYYGGGWSGTSPYSSFNYDGANATGGGASGDQFQTGPGGSINNSGFGGHGSVIVSFPKSKCIKYNTGSMVTDSLVTYFDPILEDCVYHPFSQSLNDVISNDTLEHNVRTDGADLTFYKHYDTNLPTIYYDETGSIRFNNVTSPTSPTYPKTLNDYFSGTISQSLDSDFSFELFIKKAFNDTYTGDYITNLKSGSVFFGFMETNDNPDQYALQYNDGTGTSETSGSSAGTDWKLLTGTYNSSSKEINFYANATLIDTVTSTNSISMNNPRLLLGNTGSYEGFDGSFSEVRIYKKELSENEIYDNFVSGHKRHYGYSYPSASVTFTNSNLATAPYTASLTSSLFSWDIQGMTQYVWSRGFLKDNENNVIQINTSSIDNTLGIEFETTSGSYAKYYDGTDSDVTLPLQTYDETLWHQHATTWNYDSKLWYYYIDGVLKSSGSISTVPNQFNNPNISVGQSGSELRIGEGGIYNYSLDDAGVLALYNSQKSRYATENETPTKKPVSGTTPVTSSLWSLIDIAYTSSYNGTGLKLQDLSTYFHSASLSSSNAYTYEQPGPGKPLDGYFVATSSSLETEITYDTYTDLSSSNEFTFVCTWYGQDLNYDSNGVFPIFADTSTNFGIYGGNSDYTSSVVMNLNGSYYSLGAANSANNGPLVGWHITQVSYNDTTKELKWNCDGISGSVFFSSSCEDTTCDRYIIERCRTSNPNPPFNGGCSYTYVDCNGVEQTVFKPYSSGTDNDYICIDPCSSPVLTDITGAFDYSKVSEDCGDFGPSIPNNWSPTLFAKQDGGHIGDATEWQVSAIYTSSLSFAEMQDIYDNYYNRY